MPRKLGRDVLAAGLAVLCLLLARPAVAHRVNVFAYVEGDTVHVECSYSRSDRVRFGAIEVKNAGTGQVYLTGKTDDKGNFSFPIPEQVRTEKADLLIHLNAGEGHQNDWTVKAAEYLGAQAPPTAAPAAAVVAQPSGVTSTALPAAPASSGPALDKAALQAVVEAAVEKKIAPIRKMLLDEREKGPSLAEIAGGIGWIVGLAGLLAYGQSRRRGGRGHD